MQEQFTNEEIINAFDSLPDSVKEAIVDVPIPEIVRGIGEEYNLHMDIVGFIYDQINLITLGLVDRDTLRTKLMSNTAFPKDKIEEIMHSINEKIFSPLREAVISYDQMKEEVVEESKTVGGVEYIEKPQEIVTEEVVSMGKDEEVLLKNQGIEINTETEESKSGYKAVTLKDIQGIKNDQPTVNTQKPAEPLKKDLAQTNTSFIQDKLNGSFAIKKEASDHSLPNIGDIKRQGGDPYREPL